MKTYLYRASNLKSTLFWPLFHSGSQFLAPATEQKCISDCRYRVIQSSFLVPVLFKEAFSHPFFIY